MPDIPRYADIKAENAKIAQQEQQQVQKVNVAKETQEAANANTNPVLANYMNPQKQGLTPANDDVDTMAVRAALSGQVDPREVMADANVSDSAKSYIMQQLQGEGQMGLEPTY